MTLIPLKKSSASPTARGRYIGGTDDFDRIFDNFFKNAVTNISMPLPSVTDMTVKMDVHETDKAYYLTVDLPGMEEKDIDLNVADGVLTLAGERLSETEEKAEEKTVHRIERSYGSFKRIVQLPTNADENKIKASMKNGVLEIEIKKMVEAEKKAKKISINKS